MQENGKWNFENQYFLKYKLKYIFLCKVKIPPDSVQMTGALFRNVYLQLYPAVYPHCSRKIGAIVIAYLSVVQGSDPRADIKAIFLS